jgi:SAM-dependent methyltransferase
MTVAETVHGRVVHPRRVAVLAAQAERFIPAGAAVLDVGSGDGQVAAGLAARRPDLHVEGIDVLLREDAAIEVSLFDGHSIPRATGSVDVVTFFDVLHHADDPVQLLREAARVARRSILVKDHICDSSWARLVLQFMDRVGNRRHGVALPYAYWSSQQWRRVIDDLRLGRDAWQVGGLGLYPWPASAVFGGRLHVFASLRVPGH